MVHLTNLIHIFYGVSVDFSLFIRRWIFNRKKGRKDVKYGKKKSKIKRKKKLNWNKLKKKYKEEKWAKKGLVVETEIGIQEDYTTSPFSLLEKKEIVHHLLISASKIFFFSVKSWSYNVT